MSKLIVVVGITGNQGASVANVYLHEPGWRVRGITRDLTKAASKEWADKGVEMVQGELDDIDSLHAAFKEAHVIFGVTDYWGPFFDPANHAKLKPGQTINEFCYELEVQRGKNIALAAASVDTLERFVFSSLPDARKRSKGKYTWVYHFDSKVKVIEYIKEEVPELNKKTSFVQLGYYLTNWKMPPFQPRKQADGTFVISMSGSGEKPFPLVDVNKDTGSFVRALVQSAPGKTLIGAGNFMNWRNYTRLWAKNQGVQATYQQLTTADMEASMPGGFPPGFTPAASDAIAYFDEFGYDGGDPNIIRPDELDVDCPTTSVEEWLKNEDFSSVL